jgi:epoxyqueuosine reductase
MPVVEGIAEKVKEFARKAGFELCGMVPVSGGGEGLPELAHFADWIAAGRAGEMGYLEARNEQGELKRSAIRNFAPWAKSVIVCAINYNSDKPYST